MKENHQRKLTFSSVKRWAIAGQAMPVDIYRHYNSIIVDFLYMSLEMMDPYTDTEMPFMTKNNILAFY